MVEETNRLLVPKPVRTLLPTGDDHPAQLLVLHYANCTAPGYQRRPKPGWLAISSAAAVWR